MSEKPAGPRRKLTQDYLAKQLPIFEERVSKSAQVWRYGGDGVHCREKGREGWSSRRKEGEVTRSCDTS